MKKYSRAVDIKHLVFYYIASFGIYYVVWFHDTFSLLRKEYNPKINPLVKIILLFIPFVNLFVIYTCFRDIKKFGEKLNIKIYFSPIFLTFFPLLFILFLFVLPQDQNNDYIFLILGILVFVSPLFSLIIAQLKLNQIWLRKEPEIEIRKNFSKAEIVWLIVFMLIIFNGYYRNINQKNIENQENKDEAKNIQTNVILNSNENENSKNLNDNPIDDVFLKKVECSGQTEKILKYLEEEYMQPVAVNTLDQIFYSPIHNSCLVAFYSKDKILGYIDAVIIDTLTKEYIYSKYISSEKGYDEGAKEIFKNAIESLKNRKD